MQANNEDVILYDVSKIQEILHCGRNAAYNLMNSKDFPSIQIGKRLYIEKKEFEKWINLLKRRKMQ